MDPELREYLDKLSENLLKMHEETRSALKTLIQGQTKKLEELSDLKSDVKELEATQDNIAVDLTPAEETTNIIPDLAASVASVKLLKRDATGIAGRTPTSCSTDGCNHNAGGDDPMAACQAAWSTSPSFTVLPGVSPTPSSEPALSLALGALAHTKYSTEGSKVSFNSIVPVSMSGAAGSAPVTTLYTAASSQGVIPTVAVTTPHTNYSGLGQELRPLPWPSFVCEVEPVHLKESCTQPESVLEEEADAMHAKLDITVAPTSMAPISQVCALLPITDMGKELQVGNVMPFDPGRKLQSRVPILLAIPHAREEVRVLPGGLENHDLLNLDTMCNIFPTTHNQWSSKISSCGIFTNGHQSNMLLVYALERRSTGEISVTWFNKGLNMKPKSPWLFNAQSARHVANILGIPMPVLTEYSALPMLLCGSAHEEGLNPRWDPGKGTKYYVQFVQCTLVKGNPKMQGTVQFWKIFVLGQFVGQFVGTAKLEGNST